MNATHRTPLLFVFTITLLILSGRTSSTEYTIDPVFFESSMPSKSNTLSQALSETEGSEKVLAMDLAVINKLPASYKIQVVAQTDSSECINKECLELSLRRATLVNQWLLEHGVPSTRLLTPIGLGNEQPISSNSTAIGRARNRYALPRVVFPDDDLCGTIRMATPKNTTAMAIIAEALTDIPVTQSSVRLRAEILSHEDI